MNLPSRGLRVLLLSPLLRGGGNAVSALRLARHLRAEGVRVRSLATLEPGFPPRLEAALRSFRPHLVHALHARKGGAAWLDHALPGDPPLVVSLTGTEIHRDLGDPAAAPRVLMALERAALVLASGRALLEAARAVVPSIAGRSLLVPKGAELPPRDPGFDLRRAAGLPRNAFVFLLPAGLRAVKDPLFALEPLARLRRRDPRVAFVHCGDALDGDLAEEFRRRAAGEPWIRSLGALPFRRMASAYAGASVVLNTSRSEGFANVLPEAMLAARPILASAVPSNAEAIRDGRTGLLYAPGDGEAFLRAAARLLRDGALRRRLGAAARREARGRFSPAAEARAVAEAYGGVPG